MMEKMEDKNISMYVSVKNIVGSLAGDNFSTHSKHPLSGKSCLKEYHVQSLWAQGLFSPFILFFPSGLRFSDSCFQNPAPSVPLVNHKLREMGTTPNKG